jgi:hypothetical protein
MQGREQTRYTRIKRTAKPVCRNALKRAGRFDFVVLLLPATRRLKYFLLSFGMLGELGGSVIFVSLGLLAIQSGFDLAVALPLIR